MLDFPRVRTIHAPEAGRGRVRSAIGMALFVVVVAAVQFVVALVAAGRPGDAFVLVGALVLVASALVFPRVVLVLAVLATMLPQRVGPAALNLSVSDAMGMLGLIAALRFVPWNDRRVRMVLSGLAIYLGTLTVSLVTHHAQKAVLEVAHRGVLFGGAILIGVAIVQSGITRQALRAFMVATGVLGVTAIAYSVTNGFAEAYVLQLQKNHAGLLLAAGFLVAFSAGRQLAWPPGVITALRVLTLLGLAATQSRAAALGLAAALAVRPLVLGRRGNQRTVSIGILVICLALLGYTAASLNANDLSRPQDEQQFTSINTRTDTYEAAIKEVWRPSPLIGGGLRYFTDPSSPTIAPHNLVISELAEVGIIGLAGMITLLIATFLALRRSRSQLAVLAMMALVLRVTQGMAEIFWVAGPLTIAIILVGIGLTEDPSDEDSPGATTLRERSSRLNWLA